MKKYCTIPTYIKNKNGEVVESKLFNDLLEYMPSRNLAKRHYRYAISESFNKRLSDDAQFDENGEITFDSYLKEADVTISEEHTLKKLNDEIKAGSYSYDDAVEKVKSFNGNHPMSEKYMATIKEGDDGRYDLSVVKRTSSNKKALTETIKNKSFADVLKYYISKAGGEVEFVTVDQLTGKQSTTNMQDKVDGVITAIQVSNGNVSIEAIEAEKAGHVCVGVTAGSELTKRLERFLQDEKIRRAILGEEYGQKDLGGNPERVLAGYLVGKAIMNNLGDKTPYEKLARRVKDSAMRIWHKTGAKLINRKSIKAALDDVMYEAERIADGFLSEDFKATPDDALREIERANDVKVTENKKALQVISQQLKKTYLQLKTMSDKDIMRDIQKLYNMSKTDLHASLTSDEIGDRLAMDGIVKAIEGILNLIGEREYPVNAMLESVKFGDGVDFFSTMAENGRRLQKVRDFVTNAKLMHSFIKQHTSPDHNGETAIKGIDANGKYTYKDSNGNPHEVHFRDLLIKLQTAIDIVANELESKQKSFVLRFLCEAYGSNHVKYVAAKMLGKKKHPLADKMDKNGVIDSGVDTYLIDSDDINTFERFLGSASNADFVTQVADKFLKRMKHEANIKTNEIQDRLKVLSERLKRIGMNDRDLRVFCEEIETKDIKKDKYGNIISSSPRHQYTQNFITDYKWGLFEQDYEEFKTNAKKEVMKMFEQNEVRTDERYKDLWDSYTEEEKQAIVEGEWLRLGSTRQGVIYQRYFGALDQNWKKSHAEYDKDRKMWIPSRKFQHGRYDNKAEFDEFLKADPERAKVYWELRAMKTAIDDAYLPDGATAPHRLPCFSGTFTAQVENLKHFNISAPRRRAFLRSQIIDRFSRTEEDVASFGSNLTYNTDTGIEKYFLGNMRDYDREQINRIPIFGVNKLSNPDRLSTNLLSSMLAYASMAHTYDILEKTVGVLEAGKEVLKGRKVGDMRTESEKLSVGDQSKAFGRYIKFLDKQVYCVGTKAIRADKNDILKKSIGAINRFGGLYFLGGNVVGGAVNWGTGASEIMREALAGQFFDMKDWALAHKLYYGHLCTNFGHNWRDFGSNNITNYTSLLVRRFNMRGDNKNEYADWNRHSRVHNIIDKSLLLPYSSGDHYMQIIPYLALLAKQRLYDIDGKKIRAIYAYKEKDIKDENGKVLTTTLEIEKPYFKSKEDIEKYKLLGQILEQYEYFDPSGDVNEWDLWRGIDGALDFIEKEIGVTQRTETSSEDTKKKLEEYHKRLMWNEKDESDIMDLGREINNRMHGIYNEMDKTAFHMNWYGKMFLSMKGWALGQAERLFATRHYSVIMNQEVEGSLRTAWKVAAGTFIDNGGWRVTLASMLLPYSENTERLMKAHGYNEFQYRNMRRNFGDYMWLGLLWALRCLFKTWDKKDSEKDGLMGFLYYYTSRLQREAAALRLPQGWMWEWKSLFDLCPAGVAAIIDLSHYISMLAGTPFADETNAYFYYQKEVPGRGDKFDSKLGYQTKKILPYVKSLYPMQYGYHAFDSYVYGQNVKSR